MIILDTSIIIDHLRISSSKESKLVQLVKKHPKETLAISVISIQELYEGKSTVEKEKEEKLIVTIAPLKILSYTFEIAQMAGKIARDSKNPVEFADSAISAIAIYYNSPLATLDKASFQGINKLKIIL